MTPQALLAELRSRDVRVWADGERLRCNAPAGALTPELRERLTLQRADLLEFLRTAVARAQQQRAIVPLQAQGARTPIFAVGGHNGDVFCYRSLAQRLGDAQPFFGLQPPGLDSYGEPLTRIEDLAAYFAAQIRAFRPEGPCIVAGYCAGGMIAFELARQLVRQRAAVPLLALFGAPHPARYRRRVLLRERLAQQVERVRKHMRALATLAPEERRLYLARKLRDRGERRAAAAAAARDPVLVRRSRVERATVAAGGRYTPQAYPGRVRLFLPAADWGRSINQPLRWGELAPDLEVVAGPDGCTLDDMLRERHAGAFAELLRRALPGD